jgi:serine/threonine-protein kinase
VTVVSDDTVSASGDPPSARYKIRQPLARGGIGAIHVAEDTTLHRDVALKEIPAAQAADPVCRERFVLEAEITGGLEHPGVVPVHGFGVHADGRPYYTMRLVKGETLLRSVERYHALATVGRRARWLAFRELLGRFVDVCHAVAYAHSRGVVHRDLKPANVMLGPFGETLVVDWGLARATGAQLTDLVCEPPLRPVAGGLLDAVHRGQPIGTPGYMSPEQAAGDEARPTADIYSLGVTLYVVLTGQLPFRGEVPAVLRQAARGEYPRPRAVKPGCPAALEAICLKAMAVRPADRYPTVLALAADVNRWLADEPVSAHRDAASIQLLRWGRRHRTVATAVLVLLLALPLVLTAHSAFLSYERAEQARLVQDATSRRAEAERQRDAAAVQLFDAARAVARSNPEAAVKLVSRALQLAPARAVVWLNHPDLDPLRSRDDFTSLQRDAERTH